MKKMSRVLGINIHQVRAAQPQEREKKQKGLANTNWYWSRDDVLFVASADAVFAGCAHMRSVAWCRDLVAQRSDALFFASGFWYPHRRPCSLSTYRYAMYLDLEHFVLGLSTQSPTYSYVLPVPRASVRWPRSCGDPPGCVFFLLPCLKIYLQLMFPCDTAVAFCVTACCRLLLITGTERAWI